LTRPGVLICLLPNRFFGQSCLLLVNTIVPWCDSEEIVVALLWLMSEGRVALEQFNTCRSSNQAGGELTPHSLVYRHNRDQTALAYPPQPTTSPMKTRGSNATAAAEPQCHSPKLRHSCATAQSCAEFPGLNAHSHIQWLDSCDSTYRTTMETRCPHQY